MHKDTEEFYQSALRAYRHQSKNNPVYRQYLRLLNKSNNKITSLSDIPFMPIEFFRSHVVTTEGKTHPLYFESSGTTGTTNSRHYVSDGTAYQRNLLAGFEQFYGPITDYSIYALLPSYLDQQHASLVYMVDHLITSTKSPFGGFYKFNYTDLLTAITKNDDGRKKLLIGVSFALWEMAEMKDLPDLSNVIVMETGGMKGRRREILRSELHQILCDAYGTQSHFEPNCSACCLQNSK